MNDDHYTIITIKNLGSSVGFSQTGVANELKKRKLCLMNTMQPLHHSNYFIISTTLEGKDTKYYMQNHISGRRQSRAVIQIGFTDWIIVGLFYTLLG